MIRNLALIGVGLLAVKYFSNKASGARYLTGVKLEIRGIAPIGLNELQVTFAVNNPNTRPSVIKSVVGDVYINNTKAARVQTYNQVTIQGNAQSIYPVTVKLNPVRAFQSLAQLFKGVAGNTIRFAGTANIDDIAQPINTSYGL